MARAMTHVCKFAFPRVSKDTACCLYDLATDSVSGEHELCGALVHAEVNSGCAPSDVRATVPHPHPHPPLSVPTRSGDRTRSRAARLLLVCASCGPLPLVRVATHVVPLDLQVVVDG